MTETNTNECIFCLKIIYDDTFDIIGEVTRQMLNALLLKVSLDKNKESVMCLECATKLQNAVDFKTACLGTDSKMSPGIELARISKDQKVCQFCRSLTQSGNCTDLQDRKESVFMIDMVQKHIPETNLSVSGELITCNSCMSSLQSLSSFITICSEIEEKINKMDRETVDGRFKLNYNKNFPLQYANVANIGEYCSNSVEDITMKNEGGCEDHTEIDNLDVNIKSEEIEIKLEYDGYERIIESSDSKKPRPRTSGTYCSYKNCKNTSDKCRGSGVNIKFFRVPKDEAMCRKWIQAIGRQDLLDPSGVINLKKLRNYRVCSDHFEDDMYYNPFEKSRLLGLAEPIEYEENMEFLPIDQPSTSFGHQPVYQKTHLEDDERGAIKKIKMPSNIRVTSPDKQIPVPLLSPAETQTSSALSQNNSSKG